MSHTFTLMSVGIAFELVAGILVVLAATYRRMYDQPALPLLHTFVSLASLCATYGFLFFLVPWPRVISYAAGVWMLSRVVELFLYFAGVGRYAIYRQPEFSRAAPALVLPLISKIIGCAVVFALSLHFFGI